jgi:DNA-binding NarL/FixJ family response regulator
MDVEREAFQTRGVVLADSDVGIRAGVRAALEPHGFRILAEAGSADEVVAAVVRHHPDACLVAVNLPGNGITAAMQIHGALPETRIVMLAWSEREEDFLESLRAGADGYLLKTVSAERLPWAVRGVIEGEAALPRKLTAALIREFRDRGRRWRLPLTVSGHPVELTAREFDVLKHLRQGEGTATIAEHLRISEITVRRHISAILHKLGVADRLSAIQLLARLEQRDLDETAPMC